MIDKKNILGKFNKIEDKMLVTRIIDKAAQAEKSWIAACSDFLDPYQRKTIESALHGVKDVEYKFDGGYKEAERTIVIFSPEQMSNHPSLSDYLTLLEIKLKTERYLSHRDYLGALMGLGIKREKIGDIIVDERSCSIIVLKDVADYILYNLNKIGHINVYTRLGKLENLEISVPRTKEIKCTVPSLRLDCIVSNGFTISRSKVAPLFSSGRVYLNWEPEDSLSAQVKEGDTVSVKGKGRVVIDEIGGTTRKGRIAVILKKLI
ncbi:MAG TPA: YlmH/Sll1252 family protein [Clostridiales bacterium]|nr:YlmH/Sll1252 family protein [Clostridiales bacterium]